MENKIYLVTGAAGFLGSHVCDELLERGDKVRALVLPGDNRWSFPYSIYTFLFINVKAGLLFP